MPQDDSSSSSDDEEPVHEPLDDKMKRLTKMGKEGDIGSLRKEVSQLNECTPEMLAFALKKSKELGNEAFQRSEYDQALEFYAGALVGDCPDKHKVYSNRSACLFHLGKYTEALVEATKAIKADRSWSKGYFRAGRAALEMDYYDEAVEMFEKGLEKEPDNKDLRTWTDKARKVRDQQRHEKQVKKHENDYSKFDALTKQLTEEEEEEAAQNDPNRIILGDKYYTSTKMEQRQLKAMLGYKEAPPPPFEPTFNPELIYRHDSRGAKTQNPVWDPTAREWRLDAKPAPSRVDYSDSTQTQAMALFLERQSDVQHVDDLLNMLDQNASAVDVYVQAVRALIQQMVGTEGGQKSRGGAQGSTADALRWLFVGVGTGLPLMTAARYLPTAQLIANTAHRATYIADLCIALLAYNGVRKEQIKLIHRPSCDLAVVDPDGEDINNLTGKVDVVVFDHELFDAGLIGKGILAKVNHAKRKLTTAAHLTVPMGASVLCVPCEMACPRGDGPDGLNWAAADECRWGAFYETMNLDPSGLREPWRALGPTMDVFDFDFTDEELKLSGQAELSFTATEDGLLTCIAFWYRMSLTECVTLDHTPEVLRDVGSPTIRGDYYRHAVQWLAAPVKVSQGADVFIRASYSQSRIRFEVTAPEVKPKERRYCCPRWVLLRLRDEERLDAYRKAIEKALAKIMAQRHQVAKLDRLPLRIAHIGAGIGQISMIAAKCAREAGLSDADVQQHGCSVVALESMPKIGNVVKRALRDNGLHQDVFFSTEDIRKLPPQPQRAQLIVCELFDAGLLGEGILPLLAAARVSMCSALEHECIPARATMWAVALEFGRNLESCYGFDMSGLNSYRGGTMVDVDAALEHGYARQMSNAFEVFRFDFENNCLPGQHSIQIRAIEDGRISAIAFWYEMQLDPEGEIVLTNWPESVPPADFAMLDRDLHRPTPLRQAVCYFQGNYAKEVEKGEEVQIDVGYTQAWPQFVWPGTEMVQKESGEMVPKMPPLPRHRLYYEKMKHETEELEKKLQGGLMYDEDMLSDGYAALERIALEPNGNPNYLIEPNNANFLHMMFFL